jgi:hypothetical protein
MMTQSGSRTAGGYAPTLRGRNAVRVALWTAPTRSGGTDRRPRRSENNDVLKLADRRIARPRERIAPGKFCASSPAPLRVAPALAVSCAGPAVISLDAPIGGNDDIIALTARRPISDCLAQGYGRADSSVCRCRGLRLGSGSEILFANNLCLTHDDSLTGSWAGGA